MVLRHLLACGGATDEEIQCALSIPGNTERPRRRELEAAGLIKDSGLRRVTAANREAIVWVAIPGADSASAGASLLPSRPSKAEMRRALMELRRLVAGREISVDLVKLGRWIATQCEKKG